MNGKFVLKLKNQYEVTYLLPVSSPRCEVILIPINQLTKEYPSSMNNKKDYLRGHPVFGRDQKQRYASVNLSKVKTKFLHVAVK